MGTCRCGKPIEDGKKICNTCLHDKRNAHYLLRKAERIIDEIFLTDEPKEKNKRNEDDVIIAS